MKSKLLSVLTAAALAVTMFAGEANAQWQGRRGGTGYDGGAQSRGQAYWFRDAYGISPNPYKGGSGCMPPPPPCYNGCGGGYASGPGWGNGGGYYPPGNYESRSSGWGVTIGGGYSTANNSWSVGPGGGRSRGSAWDIGGTVSFGETRNSTQFRPITMEYRPSRDGYYNPQPLQGW